MAVIPLAVMVLVAWLMATAVVVVALRSRPPDVP